MIQRKRIRRVEDNTEPNITPLLDIVFILLIFFIVTSTFLREDGLVPNLPEPQPETDKLPPPALLLYVQEDGFVLVDDARIIDPMSVKPVAEEFLSSEEDGIVQITTALDAESGVSITVLDQAILAARNYQKADRVSISKASE